MATAAAPIAPRLARIWCDDCSSAQPLVVDHVTHGDGTPDYLDLVCGGGRLVVAVLHDPPAESADTARSSA